MAALGQRDRQLTEIANLQKCDGSFQLDDRLAKLVGLDKRTLQYESSLGGFNESAFATTVVLAFFVLKLEDLQADWDLMGDKSKLWLNTHHEATAESMFEKALSLF